MYPKHYKWIGWRHSSNRKLRDAVLISTWTDATTSVVIESTVESLKVGSVHYDQRPTKDWEEVQLDGEE